jgi:hypothetical protein
MFAYIMITRGNRNNAPMLDSPILVFKVRYLMLLIQYDCHSLASC